MDKQYSEAVEKLNKRKNKVLRVTLTILLVILALLTLAFTLAAIDYSSSHHTTYDVYVNGIFSGNTVTRSDSGPYTFLAIIGYAASFAIFAILFNKKGKDIHDFREGIELDEKVKSEGILDASKKRERLYKISKYAGFTGADRFASGCILRGLVKLICSFWGLACTSSYISILIERGRANPAKLVVGLPFLALAVFLWIKDTKALKKGTYTDRKRNCIK